MPSGILLLIFVLTIWNPAALALSAASALASIGSRPTASLVFLGLRLVLTSVGVASGIALWLHRPGAVSFAKAALALFGIEAVVRLSSRVDLGSAPPGTRLPLALLIVLHNAAWYLYLQTSRRVRACYGLESQSRNAGIRVPPPR
jgi:hypothetical protein